MGYADPFDGLAQAFCKDARVLGAGVDEDDAEFFTPVAPSDIGGANGLAQYGGGLADDFIAGLVTVGIVDLLNI